MTFANLNYIPGKDRGDAGGDADGAEYAPDAGPVARHMARGQDHFWVRLVAETLDDGAQAARHLEEEKINIFLDVFHTGHLIMLRVRFSESFGHRYNFLLF